MYYVVKIQNKRWEQKNMGCKPMLGGSHLFSKTINFGFLCFYVRTELILDFWKKLVLERTTPVFNVFK
jgi:hypothetical protein